MKDDAAEREALYQIIRKVWAEYRTMSEDAAARVIAGRIQGAGFTRKPGA